MHAPRKLEDVDFTGDVFVVNVRCQNRPSSSPERFARKVPRSSVPHACPARHRPTQCDHRARTLRWDNSILSRAPRSAGGGAPRVLDASRVRPPRAQSIHRCSHSLRTATEQKTLSGVKSLRCGIERELDSIVLSCDSIASSRAVIFNATFQGQALRPQSDVLGVGLR